METQLILDLYQIQPMRWRGRSGLSSVAALQNFSKLFRTSQIATHVDERPHDVSHHVAQKRRRLYREEEKIVSLIQPDSVNFPDRMRGVAACRPKRGEIMLALDAADRGAHFRKV